MCYLGDMARKAIPLTQRFWLYVQKTDGCWIWTGATTYGGYGVIRECGRAGKIVRAHRFSYQLAHGPFDPALDVCHTCDTPPCVNPSHLFLGDAKANVADMLAKGRASGGGMTGEDHPMAKLTWEKVDEIRELRATHGHSLNALAQRFNVSKKSILNIVKHKVWVKD